MGVPQKFPQSNVTLGPPSGMTLEDCNELSACRSTHDGHPTIVSCWKLSPQELTEISKTGQVWLVVWGRNHPPVCVTGEWPFEEPEQTPEDARADAENLKDKEERENNEAS